MNEVDIYLDSLTPLNPKTTPKKEGLPIDNPSFKTADYQQVHTSFGDHSLSRQNQTGEVMSNERNGGLHGKVFHSYRVQNGRGGEDEVRVTASLFKNRWYLVHRRFYLDTAKGWSPGPQGLNTPAKEITGTVRGMIAAMDAFREAGIPIDGGDA